MASTSSVCGDFGDLIHTDHGQCNPRRLKRDCGELTDVPSVSECVDENVTLELFPELTPPFRTISTVFDQDCLPVLDTNDEPVTGPTI